MATSDFPSLKELSRQIGSLKITAVEIVEQCLARIQERDEEVRAWAYVAEHEALEEAKRCAKELETGPPRSRLHGIPFGVKDIFDTAGMPTEWGSPLDKGRVPERDAAVVARLTDAGAIVLGKTHTTAYAYFDPAPTRNPCNPRHTPGGSSSGSAAAVADGMVPFALGSQTMGSILRPASFCGIVGLKPTFGRLPAEGVLPFAPTLDHPGPFTRTVEDMAFLWEAMTGGKAVEEPVWRLAAPKWPIKGCLEPEMEEGFEGCLEQLRSARWTVEPLTLPERLLRLPRIINTVLKFEAARVHRERFEKHGSKMGRKLAVLIAAGLEISESMYRAALEDLEAARQDYRVLGQDYPVWVTPSAIGPAPCGLESTGDPRCNAPFTALGAPALSLPFGTSREGLPLGLQLSAPRNSESVLLATGFKIESVLRS